MSITRCNRVLGRFYDPLQSVVLAQLQISILQPDKSATSFLNPDRVPPSSVTAIVMSCLDVLLLLL